MNHYTYLLQSKENDMMYIGVRSCAVSPEVDNYWGSSKHLPKNVSEVYDKFILGTFDSRVEASIDEITRHRINDVAKSKLFWNNARATTTGFCTAGRQRPSRECDDISIRQSGKGNSMYGNSSPFKGRSHSEEAKQQMSNARAGKPLTEEHKANISKAMSGGKSSWYGRKHSEESKQKMSTSRTGEGNHMYGRKLEVVGCPHCDTKGAGGSMKRWHFDNCKENK